MERIKRCPFCGLGASWSENEYDGFQLGCNNESCDVKPDTGVYAKKEQAIAAWNKRGGIDV